MSVDPKEAAPNPLELLASVGVARGTLVGGAYRIERLLGVSGMGLVALAVDEKLERHVAIKFVKRGMFAVPAMHTLFAAEARAMARLSHPNVLAVHAYGDHLETPYFVIEYVAGQTAERWLADRPAGTLPTADEVLRLLDQVCLGVEAIHASGTVHRDLKPSNLLIDASFRVAVGDFGVARAHHDSGSNALLVGTAAYMAPEAAFGEESPREQARDIYAIGAVRAGALDFLAKPPSTWRCCSSRFTTDHLGDERRPRGRDPRAALSGGSLLPAQRRAHRHPGRART